jgi:hypothetical protein
MMTFTLDGGENLELFLWPSLLELLFVPSGEIMRHFGHSCTDLTINMTLLKRYLN